MPTALDDDFERSWHLERESDEAAQARWERFRWNQIIRLEEQAAQRVPGALIRLQRLQDFR